MPEKYINHQLLPDLVLIYKIEKDRLVLVLFDIGTHANLFKENRRKIC